MPNIKEVESFKLDHTKVIAPYVREAQVMITKEGSYITKYDIRFTQPNQGMLESDVIHTIEHLLAVSIRETAVEFENDLANKHEIPDIVDLSPMGCRTGFYMVVVGKPDVKFIKEILLKSIQKALEIKEVPAQNPIQCGSYKLHNIEGAKKELAKFADKL
jgi:S-ribosylhomocysteine lyase